MNKKRDILTDVYRERFKDYQLPVDEGQLWVQLQQNLYENSDPNDSPPVVPDGESKKPVKWTLFLNIFTAAAITIGVTVGVFMQKEKEPEKKIYSVQQVEQVRQREIIKSPVDEEVIEETTSITAPVRPHEQVMQTTAHKERIEILESQGRAVTNAENLKFPRKLDPEVEREITHLLSGKLIDPIFYKPKTWSLRLLFGSLPLIRHKTYTSVSGEQPYNENFEMPFNIGLSVKKDLGYRWGIEAGFLFTQMQSTIAQTVPEQIGKNTLGQPIQTLPGQTIDGTKKVSYLGIPIKMHYYFYRDRRISLYGQAGGMVEMNVYAKEYATVVSLYKKGIIQTDNPAGGRPVGIGYETSTEQTETVNDLKTSRLQWSVTGNLGIDLKLIDNFGLFIEPHVIYYFDNHSGVDSYRKEYPFSFDIQGGIRLVY